MWNLEQIRRHTLGQLSFPLSNFDTMGSMGDKGMAVDRSWRGHLQSSLLQLLGQVHRDLWLTAEHVEA